MQTGIGPTEGELTGSKLPAKNSGSKLPHSKTARAGGAYIVFYVCVHRNGFRVIGGDGATASQDCGQVFGSARAVLNLELEAKNRHPKNHLTLLTTYGMKGGWRWLGAHVRHVSAT